MHPTPIIFAIFQTGNGANGGVESITQVIEHRQRQQSVIVTQLQTPVNQRWQRAGAHVEVWPLPYTMGSSFYGSSLWGQLQRLWSLLCTNYQAFRLVHHTGSRVVHHNDPSAFWHLALGAKMAGAKVVFNVRDTKAEGEPYNRKWSVAYRLCDRLLVLSKEMRQSLLQHLPGAQGRPDKLQAIYSIVDTTRLHPLSTPERQALRQRLGIRPDTLALGYVATLNPKKAQLEFIQQAVAPLRQAIPQLKIYFIGDCEPQKNPYARACLAATRQLGLADTVEFVGYTPEVVDWYRAVDMGVLASRKEGLARCMIESLACGTPVVSFDVCSAREILQGYDCGRVVSRDYGALVAAIANLAQQPQQRQRLGENGVKAVQTLFQPAAVVAQYESLYGQLESPPETPIASRLWRPRRQSGSLL